MATPSVIINLEPNWDNEPEVSYGFSTVVQDTPYFKQQRRPLVPTPTRMQNCRYTFIDADIQYARNLLLYAAPRLCYIPIYSEPVQAGAVTQGASAITALTDITYYWNLQNCDYAIILNFLTGQSEAVVVASVSGQVINLTGAIVQSWDAASCVIYPAFAGRISAMKETAVTSRLLELDAQFEEISIGEEATKVWVGLDEQICIDTRPRLVSPLLVTNNVNADDGSAYWGAGLTYFQAIFPGYPLVGDSSLTGYPYMACFMRFTNAQIPAGVRITEAFLDLVTRNQYTGPTYVEIGIDLSDNATAPTTYASFEAKTWSEERIPWVIPFPSPTGTGGYSMTTPDIGSLIQLVIDRPGWVIGNSIQLLMVKTIECPPQQYTIWRGFGEYPGVTKLRVS